MAHALLEKTVRAGHVVRVCKGEDVMPAMMAQVQKAEHDGAGLALGGLISLDVFAFVVLCLDYMGR